MDMQLVLQNESDQFSSGGYMNTDVPEPYGRESGLQTTTDPISSFFQDPPVLIAIMGVTGSGKTTFVNQASRSRLQVGEDLRSCTSEIQVSEEFILDGRRVVLIDTPGFDDTHRSDTDVLKLIASFLGESYSAGVKLAGVIYVHRISDDKFGGVAAKNFRMFRELCGEKTLKNVILMTNMWGRVTSQRGAEREQQLKDEYFKAAIDKGARMCRHNNSPESARAILRKILENQPVVLKIQQELIDEGMDIGQTGAGAELNREIRELVDKHQKEIGELKESMRKAIEERDEESREELEEEKKRVEEIMERLLKDSAEMALKFEEARRDMEGRIRARVEAEAAQIREAYEAEIKRYEGKMSELEGEGTRNASHIASLEEEVEELKRRLASRKCIIM